MRNFEERMEEIQKRSHVRIARRKKQLTSVFAMLAVVLCCGGWMLLQPEQPSVVMVEDDPVSTTETQRSFHGSVTVYNGNESLRYTEEEIFEGFQKLVEDLPPAQTSLTDADASFTSRVEVTSLTMIYTIEVESDDGEVVRYQLRGKILHHEASGAIYALTDLQRLELLELLGIH